MQYLNIVFDMNWLRHLLAVLVAVTFVSLHRGSLLAYHVDAAWQVVFEQVRYSNGQLYCRGYDLVGGRDIEKAVQTRPPGTILTNFGIVTWTTQEGVSALLYDSGRTRWASYQRAAGRPAVLLSANGFFAWRCDSDVWAAVYDPVRGAWIDSCWTTGPTYNLQCTNGVVAWSTSDTVYFAAYDPVRSAWILDSVRSAQTYDLSLRDGQVAWSSGGLVYVRVYDPRRGTWLKFEAPAGPIVSLQNSLGIVAWRYRNTVNGVVYDPKRDAWVSFSQAGESPAGLQIIDATIEWSVLGETFRRGYDPTVGQWTIGRTRPISFFVPSVSKFDAPGGVLVADMSVGAIDWLWSLDQIGPILGRGIRLWFTAFGRYELTQRASNSAGFDLRSMDIITDITPPSGTISIENGTGLATNRTVVLNIQAADNSGGPIQVQLRNEDGEWTDWEALNPRKVWTLSEGNGLKTVWARFRDAVGNVSPEVSTSIRLDTTPAPVASFSVGSTSLVENIGIVTLSINLDHPFSRTAILRVRAEGITATENLDYVFNSIELSFMPGITNATIAVRILNDQEVELNEQFRLVIEPIKDVVAGAECLVTILDDDPPTIRCAVDQLNVDEGSGEVLVPVEIVPPSGMSLAISYAIYSQSAVPWLDFIPQTNQVKLSSGVSVVMLPVRIIDNNIDQPTRTCVLKLLPGTNYTLGAPRETVIFIADNDPPTVSFAKEKYLWQGTAGTARLTVQLSEPWNDVVLVEYDFLESGTALAGVDYVAIGGALAFPPGETQRNIGVSVLQNPRRTRPVDLYVRINHVANGQVGMPQVACLVIFPELPPQLTIGWSEGVQRQLYLGITGFVGQRVQLQRSSDLIYWEPADELRLNRESVKILIPVEETDAVFYRLLLLPIESP